MIYIRFIHLCLFKDQQTAKEQDDTPYPQVLHPRLTHMGSAVPLRPSAHSACSTQVQENLE